MDRQANRSIKKAPELSPSKNGDSKDFVLNLTDKRAVEPVATYLTEFQKAKSSENFYRKAEITAVEFGVNPSKAFATHPAKPQDLSTKNRNLQSQKQILGNQGIPGTGFRLEDLSSSQSYLPDKYAQSDLIPNLKTGNLLTDASSANHQVTESHSRRLKYYAKPSPAPQVLLNLEGEKAQFLEYLGFKPCLPISTKVHNHNMNQGQTEIP